MPRDYWGQWEDIPPPAPLLPPPEHGVRVGKIGATWWGERWVGALARFGGHYVARLRRGRGYARQGRVHDLDVSAGTVTASVTGSRPTPYRVTLSLRPLADGAWERALLAMAAKARFAAALLGGEMPRGIDQAFAAAGASLFPARSADLRAACTCPDDANPCKHIAAVHYVLAEAFDRDPFLLFELRGRSREAVMAALQAARSEPRGRRPDRVRSVDPGRVDPAAYDAFRAPVDDLRFRISEPAAPGAVLRQLGPPPGWRLDTDLADLVQAAVSRAAARARELALGGETAAPAQKPERDR
jgi:uncharacterized Zn finger protein